MQASTLSPGTSWLDLVKVPAIVLTSIAFLVRWVLAPATKTYLREDLKPELEQVKRIPVLESRVERLEGVIERLGDVPAAIARIEGLLEERR